MLSAAQLEDWERDGYVLVESFASQRDRTAMLEAILAVVRADHRGEDIRPTYVQQEGRLVAEAERPEDCVSKVFRVHRNRPVFEAFAHNGPLLDMLAQLIAPELDCFLSQFIFKLPGALGQPWHQDSFYFPFDRGPQVGVWVAVSDAEIDNGPLWVLPGSHRDPIHPVEADRREHANLGYVEIVGRDTSGEIPVLMKAGDTLLFHSHLMHRSTDNTSDRMRAAMVYHYGEAGTVDNSQEKFGFRPPNIDWMPVRRAAD